MRRQRLRVELRLDGELKARYQGRYLAMEDAARSADRGEPGPAQTAQRSQRGRQKPLDAGLLRSSGPPLWKVDGRLRKHLEAAGRSSRFYAQSLRSEISPKQWNPVQESPPGAPETSRVLRHRRAFADCFGANPVASAFGTPPGATPARLCEHNIRVLNSLKPELSTWLGIGTFYLAPTKHSSRPT